MRYQADQPAGLEAEEEQRRRQWLRLTRTWSDGYRIEGELDAENGGLAGDERPALSRRAEALVEMARCALDAGRLPERGGERPHLSLLASLETLRLVPGSPLAELDWGGLVTGETARRIGCDAVVTPVLLGGDGDVLHVGRRTRTIPTRLRRALHARDRHCQASGCTMPASRCQVHHHDHWADGGRTDIELLSLRCPVHHAQLHPENARFRQQPEATGRSGSPPGPGP